MYVQNCLTGKVTDFRGKPIPGHHIPWQGRRQGRRANRRWGTCWSPEQISRRLQIDYPDDQSMRMSHEALYQALYIQGRGALRRELTACLRSGRALRVPRTRTQQRPKHFVTPQVMINERPALAGHGAEAVRNAIATKITQLPEYLRRSLTWDQGAEMAQHAQLRLDTTLAIYFCDAQSPWQRGTNGTTNGLPRQYFPKGTDMSRYTERELDAVANILTCRPRKTLGWKTPADAIQDLLSET